MHYLEFKYNGVRSIDHFCRWQSLSFISTYSENIVGFGRKTGDPLPKRFCFYTLDPLPNSFFCFLPLAPRPGGSVVSVPDS